MSNFADRELAQTIDTVDRQVQEKLVILSTEALQQIVDASLKTKLKERDTELEERFEVKLKDSETKSEQKYTKLNNEHNELKVKYTELNDKYTDLNDKYTDLKDKYTDLKDKYTEIDSRLADVEALNNKRIAGTSSLALLQQHPFKHNPMGLF